MNSHLWVLVGVMVVGGVFGGLVNYYINFKQESTDASMVKSVVIGLGASSLVPVFLNMISSDLVKTSGEDPGRLLVFFGFCVLAAVSSRAFIRSLSEKVLRELRQEVDDVKEEVKPLIEKETESENGEESISEISESALRDNPDYLRVLKALDSRRYSFRSVTGVSQETAIDAARVRQVLDDLTAKGLAAQTTGKRGIRWYITKAGRMYGNSV